LLIFGIVLPITSIFLELERVTKGWKEGEIHDNYELLYVYLKFPIYWVMGVIQVVVAIRFLGKKEIELPPHKP